MKQIITLLGIIFLTLSSCSKEEIEPDNTFDLSSSLNGFEYEISVIEKNTNPNSVKNIIFVLDSDDLIPIVLNEFETLGSTKPLAIVGIKSKENGKRVRDYTPTKIDSEESGKAEVFFRFIQQDVIPELESRQIIDSTSSRSIMGHSIGGLATCFAFTSFNSLFDKYVALSPSLFWDDFVFFDLEHTARNTISQNESKVFLGIGEDEDFGITNGFSHFVEIIETHYSSAQLNSAKVSGSHFGSRNELINRSLNFILE